MPRLPGICEECGSVYPSPLRAEGPGRAPAFQVPAPCPLCGGSGRVPPDVLDRIAALRDVADRVGRDPTAVDRLASMVEASALEPGEELDPDEERVRRARLRSRLDSELGAGGRMVDALPAFRRGEVEAVLRPFRIAVELGDGDGGASAGDRSLLSLERILEEAYARSGSEESHGERGSDPDDRARGRLKEAGRNDPCPCGSGTKYKDCHWLEDLRVTR